MEEEDKIVAIVVDDNGRFELTKSEFDAYVPPVVETPDLCNRINLKLDGNSNAEYVLRVWDLYAQYSVNPNGVSEDDFYNKLPEK